MNRDVPAEQAIAATTTEQLMDLLPAALAARSPDDWSRWLQGGLQDFLPHHALIAAWGDFRACELEYEVFARAPEVSSDAFPRDVIEPLLATLFAQWLAAGRKPLGVDTRALRSVGSSLFACSPRALVHGVQDCRSHCDFVYVLVGPETLATPLSEHLFGIALPYVDTGFRQLSDHGHPPSAEQPCGIRYSFSCYSGAAVAHESAPHPTPPAAPAAQIWTAPEPRTCLSAREFEVMKWVRMGKTNSEIAIILNLSTFTVKNHMRRIYKKLDVLNRAQAVGSLDRAYAARECAQR